MTPRRPNDSVEITGLSVPEPVESSAASKPAGRPWLGVYFRCCHVYARVPRNAAGTAYVGRCPRCGAEISAKVGPGGTAQRIFFAE